MVVSSTTMQYLIVFSVSLISATVGVTMTWPATVIPKFHDDQTNIEVSDNEIAWIVALAYPGYIIGGIVTSKVSERCGRRVVVLASIVPCLIGSIIVIIAKSASLLYANRYLWGLGRGIITTISNIYIIEIVQKEIRNSAVVISTLMMNFGNFFTLVVGPFVPYTTLNYIILGFPIACVLFCWWIPETPYYYLKKGRVDDAIRVLMRTRGIQDEQSQELEDELLQIKSQVDYEMQNPGSLKDLFTGKQYRKALLIGLGLKITEVCSGQFVIMYYVAPIVRESQLHLTTAVILIVFGSMKIIASMLSSVVVHRIGRRPLLISTYLGTAISLAAVTVYFFLQDVIRLDYNNLSPFSFIPFVGLILSSVISSLGFLSVVTFFTAELFPSNVQSSALLFLYIIGGLISFFVARGYQVTKNLVGLSGVFGIYTLISLIGCVISVFVPETKSNSTEEIQVMLQGDLYKVPEVEHLNPVLSEGGNVQRPIEMDQMMTDERIS